MKLTVEKTYTDWLALLGDLAKGTLTLDSEQEEKLAEAASDWPSCACGQLCSALPRNSEGAPKDLELYALGLDFNDAIGDGDYSYALTVFKTIERRSTRLLSELEHTNTLKAKQQRAKLVAQRDELNRKLAQLS